MSEPLRRESAVPAKAEEKVHTDRKRWFSLAFVSVSLFILAVDDTVLNVALPSISRDLGSSASQLQWMIDAYILVFAALLLTMGSIGDRIGRKRMLQAGLVLFGVFSAWAALSSSSGMLITARAFLGFSGAMIMPSTLSILTATFEDPKERAQAIAIWAAVFALGLGVGPLMAGVLLEHYSWSSVFVVNIPIVIIALIGGHLFVKESRDETVSKPDIPGTILSITGLFLLVYGIIKAGEGSWAQTNVIVALSSAVVILSAFAWWEKRAPNAMLPLRFFRNMSFTGANTTLILVTFCLFGILFFLSQYFQSVQGYTPLQTGIRILPMALILTMFAAGSARIAMYLGTKFTVSLGCIIAAGGLLMLALSSESDTSYWPILVAMLVGATGVGITMSPATNSVMGSVPVNQAGIGSAMNDSTRLVGGALGIAVLGTVMNGVYLDKIGVLEIGNNISPDAYEGISSSIQGAHIVAESVSDPNVSQAIIKAADQAFVAGMSDAFMVAAFVMAAASVISLLILPSKIRPTDN